jgi:hypothetical protein
MSRKQVLDLDDMVQIEGSAPLSMRSIFLDYLCNPLRTQASKQCSQKASREWDGNKPYQTINPAVQGI